MQNQRGFIGVGVLIAILLGAAVLGGGAYYVVNQQSTAQTSSENVDNFKQLPTTNNQKQTQSNTNVSAKTAPAQNPATVAGKITITAPTTGATLPADQQTTVRWTIPSSVLNLFPQDFDVYVFLYAKDSEGINGVSIGDGNKASVGSATWNIPSYITSGSLKPGTYKISAQLQAQTKDPKRMCVVSLGGGECGPSPADSAVMAQATKYTAETGWITIVPSATVKFNDAPVIESLTGPTSLRVGEKGTWVLTASDDSAALLKHSCYIGLYKELDGPGGTKFMGSTGGGGSGPLPVQSTSPGTSVVFTFTPSNPTTGKEYYDISCNVIEPLPNNGELGARYQKNVQFTVSP